MEDLKIGIAEIVYSEDGKVLRAFFTPTMRIGNVAEQLMKIRHGNAAQIRQDAEIVLSSWFNKMNEIELADRSEYEISSEVLSCTQYPDGGTKRCKIEFTFKKLDNANQVQENASSAR